MTKRLALLASCLALGLVASGCGSDDEQDAGSTEAPAKTTEAPATAEPSNGAAKSVVAVSMKDTLYVPADVRVKKGGTVKWTNDDSFAHTVTKGSGPGAEFDSGTVEGGGKFEQKFTEAGKVDYVCTIHPSQVGTITVE